MAAIIPERHITHNTLRALPVDTHGYVVPWAMVVRDSDNTAWLNGNYTYETRPHGTAKMLVQRSLDGYYVTIPDGETYQPTAIIPWVGARREDLIPVAGFIE